MLEAADGAQAIEILEGGQQPDLVFADLVMPGPATIARAVTELLNEPFFTKPYDISEVVARMRMLLSDEEHR